MASTKVTEREKLTNFIKLTIQLQNQRVSMKWKLQIGDCNDSDSVLHEKENIMHELQQMINYIKVSADEPIIKLIAENKNFGMC